jgi:hypothetical protein
MRNIDKSDIDPAYSSDNMFVLVGLAKPVEKDFIRMLRVLHE